MLSSSISITINNRYLWSRTCLRLRMHDGWNLNIIIVCEMVGAMNISVHYFLVNIYRSSNAAADIKEDNIQKREKKKKAHLYFVASSSSSFVFFSRCIHTLQLILWIYCYCCCWYLYHLKSSSVYNFKRCICGNSLKSFVLYIENRREVKRCHSLLSCITKSLNLSYGTLPASNISHRCCVTAVTDLHLETIKYTHSLTSLFQGANIKRLHTPN